MRLADADLLPFDFDNFTDTMRRYVDEVQKLARERARCRSSSATGRSTTACSPLTDDPRHPLLPPQKRDAFRRS